MKLYDFWIEYRKEPFGLSVRIPRFSWKLESAEKDTMQTAYRIQVFSGKELAWDSKRQDSAQSVLVPYDGKELEEETAYQVYLSVEDNHGNTAQSQSSFYTGIFDAAHLQAKMIKHDFENEETACPVFYRCFAVAKKNCGKGGSLCDCPWGI